MIPPAVPGIPIGDYRKPRKGCVAFPVRALPNEDAAQVAIRVAAYPWAKRIVGKAQRVGQRWIFELRAP